MPFTFNQLSSCYRAVFARRFFYKWNRLLLHCSLKGLGVNNFGDKITGEAAFLRDRIATLKSPVVLDVGANVGLWSKLAIATNPDVQIYAFEPNLVECKKLENIAQVKPFALACGAQEGEGTLYNRALGSTQGSLNRAVLDHLDADLSTQKTPIITLDRFIAEHEIAHIDLLKIDVEGLEYEVLMGAKEALQSGRIKAIQFEFNATHVYHKRFFRDFYDLLKQCNYTLYRLLPKGRIPLRHYDPTLHELFTYQNIAAIRH